jgi:hypothetical protein
VPQTHVEKWGMARQEAGVSLYSRKVRLRVRVRVRVRARVRVRVRVSPKP